ncbi:unnamed protein product, partial [marine sediment metagenome]
MEGTVLEMGRSTVTKSKAGRFLVVLEKVTFPDGTTKTLPSIPSSIERPPIPPRNMNQILRRLEKEYEKLAETFDADNSDSERFTET